VHNYVYFSYIDLIRNISARYLPGTKAVNFRPLAVRGTAGKP
jgi:hypothetical protein